MYLKVQARKRICRATQFMSLHSLLEDSSLLSKEHYLHCPGTSNFSSVRSISLPFFRKQKLPLFLVCCYPVTLLYSCISVTHQWCSGIFQYGVSKKKKKKSNPPFSNVKNQNYRNLSIVLEFHGLCNYFLYSWWSTNRVESSAHLYPETAYYGRGGCSCLYQDT